MMEAVMEGELIGMVGMVGREGFVGGGGGGVDWEGRFWGGKGGRCFIEGGSKALDIDIK